MSFPNESRTSPFAAWSRHVGTLRSRWAAQPLRQQLLVSHVGLVILVVLGFGFAMYWLSRQATYREAEADLLAAAQLLAQDISTADDGAKPRLSETYFHRFGPALRDQAYFAAWDASGRRIAASEGLPPEALPASVTPPTHGPRPFTTRRYGSNLDVMIALPQGGQLLLGRPLAKEFDRLNSLVLRLLLAGTVCAILGLIAARWLARQIVQPLERMTATAETVSSRDRSRRLDVGNASPELVRLAAVFNAMLDRLQTEFDKQARFTADASHELRTPVSIVLSQAEHALARERSAEDYRAALETCVRAARRMRKLVDDLLLLSRADAAQMQLRRQTVDFEALVRSAVELLQPVAEQYRVQVETKTTPVRLSGDPDRLSQVVTNLVANAVQYNVPDGRVVVEIRREAEAALLIVRDTGVGISPEDQPRLFERFYRADQARTHRDDAGTGLGLSLVAEIVTAHDGTIDVQSPPGTGTTITVRLPIESPSNPPST